MTEETKVILNKVQDAGNKIKETGKQFFSPRNLKRGAGALVVLAVIGAGGKYFIHQNKAEAKARTAEARTTLLQNLAAQNNIQLVSQDAVKDTVAQTLGTAADQVSFKSVNLVSPVFDREDGKNKDKKEDKKSGHQREEKRGDKREHGEDKEHGKKHAYGDNKEHGEKHAYGDNKEQGRQPFSQGQPVLPGQPGSAPQSAPAAGAANPAATAPVQTPAATPAAPAPGTAPDQQLARNPLFYSVKCSLNNVDYQFVVDAQSGKILRSHVEDHSSLFNR
jgi:hypothetical protein